VRNKKTKVVAFLLLNLVYTLAGMYLLIFSMLYLAWFLIPKPVLFIIVLIELAGILSLGYYINKAYSKHYQIGTDGQFMFAKWASRISGILLLFGGSSPLWLKVIC
jgi:hypothetical protein